MEDKGIKQESDALAAGVYELPGEPAIVINGVPDIIPGDGTIAPHNASSKVETHVPSGLGEWFEGREVQKWFMGRYYSGIVTEFDKDSGWYRVHYEDGDSEDLDWQELEEVLLPLDVTVPLKALAQRIVKKDKKSVPKSVKNVAAHSQNSQIKRRTTKGK
ncbi:Dirigent protein 17 [Spatholobus suberectus]|nr:Dirigent protein 17 [Spatholobus suberectus]